MKINREDIKKLGDKNYRLSNLWHIKDKNQRLIKFKLNRAQKHFSENAHTRNILLKSRQLGFTTFEIIDTLDEVCFKHNFDALFIAQDLETAKDIFDNKIWLAWDNYKLKELYKLNTETARQLKLGFGSSNTVSSLTVDNSGRSGTYRRVHISEFGLVCKKYPDKAKEIIEGTIPAVPMDGRVDIESTAEGSSGKFYDMFWEAWERGQPKQPTQYKAHFYNWQWDDEEIGKITDEQIKDFINGNDYQQFKEYQKRNNLSDKEITYYYLKWLALGRDMNALHTQYPTTAWEAFQSSGNKLFDEIALAKLAITPPIKIENQKNYYSDIKLDHNYVVGVDVGEGIGKDHSTIIIIDLSPLKPRIVATYKNNRIAPDLLAYDIKNLATEFNYAFVAIERNNHGHTTISKLRDIYSENLIYRDDKDKLGWQTNLVNKPKMFYDLSSAVNNELIDIPSQAIVSEMRRYDKEDLRIKTYDDEQSEHYDLLTACCIAFQMKDERPKMFEQHSSYTASFVATKWKH